MVAMQRFTPSRSPPEQRTFYLLIYSSIPLLHIIIMSVIRPTHF